MKRQEDKRQRKKYISDIETDRQTDTTRARGEGIDGTGGCKGTAKKRYFLSGPATKALPSSQNFFSRVFF